MEDGKVARNVMTALDSAGGSVPLPVDPDDRVNRSAVHTMPRRPRETVIGRNLITNLLTPTKNSLPFTGKQSTKPCIFNTEIVVT